MAELMRIEASLCCLVQTVLITRSVPSPTIKAASCSTRKKGPAGSRRPSRVVHVAKIGDSAAPARAYSETAWQQRPPGAQTALKRREWCATAPSPPPSAVHVLWMLTPEWPTGRTTSQIKCGYGLSPRARTTHAPHSAPASCAPRSALLGFVWPRRPLRVQPAASQRRQSCVRCARKSLRTRLVGNVTPAARAGIKRSVQN